MLICESLHLICVCSIEDGVLRFCHVGREEETSHNACHLIFIRTLWMHTRVNRSPSIAFNLNRYNSSNERLRLSHYKTIHLRTITRHVAPSLSENRQSQLIDAIARSRLHHLTYA